MGAGIDIPKRIIDGKDGVYTIKLTKKGKELFISDLVTADDAEAEQEAKRREEFEKLPGNQTESALDSAKVEADFKEFQDVKQKETELEGLKAETKKE